MRALLWGIRLEPHAVAERHGLKAERESTNPFRWATGERGLLQTDCSYQWGAQNLSLTAVMKCLISAVVSQNLGPLYHSWTAPKHKQTVSTRCQHGCVFPTSMSVSSNVDDAFRSPLLSCLLKKKKKKSYKIASTLHTSVDKITFLVNTIMTNPIFTARIWWSVRFSTCFHSSLAFTSHKHISVFA